VAVKANPIMSDPEKNSVAHLLVETSQKPPKLLLAAQDVARPSLLAGCVGATAGGLLGVYRGHSVPLYSVSIGTNWLLLGGAIFTAEKAFSVAINRPSDAYSYGAGGLLGGGFLSGIHAGRQGILAGALLFGLSSAGSRYAFEGFAKRI